MKYLDEFREPRWIEVLLQEIRNEADPGRHYRLMEFCGGHTHALYRYGLLDLLPENIHMVHGPGCPVCVLPRGRLDSAIGLVQRPEVILCSYGDMLRVPGSERRSLLSARADGGDVRMVYSVSDALQVARDHPGRQVVFFAVGFETTTPPTAVALKRAAAEGLDNFSVYCNHVLTPAALAAILGQQDVRIDGFLGPGHVSTITGPEVFGFAAREYHKPLVITGFEPTDLLQGIRLLLRQLNTGAARVENAYRRAVADQGNPLARELMAEVFVRREQFEWRGLGMIPHSALALAPPWVGFDAERRFAMTAPQSADHGACECAAVLTGHKRPKDCRLFAIACTPQNPLGSCMVSSEGACAACYSYGRHRRRAVS